MRACDEIQSRLAAFIEGATSPEETRRIVEHLTFCQECGEALEELKKTVDLVKNLDEVEPPPFFTQKVMAHIREEAEKSKVMGHGSWVTKLVPKLFYPLHIKIPVEAFAFVLVVGLVFLVYRSMEPEMKLATTPTQSAAPALKDQAEQVPKTTLPSLEAPHQEAPLKKQAQEPSDVVGSAKKEEGPAPTAPMRQKMVEKKGEVLAEKPAQEPSVAFAPPPKESPQLQKAPAAPASAGQARQATEAESPGIASGASKDRMDRGAAPPAREYRAAAKGVEQVEFVIRAPDVGSAAKEAEALLSKLGARGIEREPREPGVIVRAVMENRTMGDLADRLKSIGQMRAEPAVPDTTYGESKVLIRIEPQH